MMRSIFISTFALAMFASASAQTILSTLPATQGECPTMAQLTPGHPDYIYAKSLLNTEFDELGIFHYVLPDQAADAKPQPRGHKGTVSADEEWTALNEGDRLWVEKLDTAPTDGSDTVEPIRQQVSDPEAASDAPDAGQSEVVWGQSVHRNEFGIDGGIFWSPKGHKLAFYRMDQSMVSQYPLLQTDPQVAEVKWIRYPMAGQTSHQVTLGIYDPDTQQTVYLRTNDKPLVPNSILAPASRAHVDRGLNDPEHYLTNITWRPDGKQILIAELNRLQNYMELNVYDVESGSFVRTLFCEESEKYVEPKHQALFLPGSNDRFIWMSERDGYMHAYLCDMSSEQEFGPLLTPGDFDVTSLVGIDPKAKNLYFMAATGDSPLESNLYSVALPKGDKATAPIVRITQATGRHSIRINKQYTKVYDVYSNHDTPRVCQLIDLKNGRPAKTQVLYTAPNPWEGYARPSVEVGTIKAADGKTDLYYRLVKPNDNATSNDLSTLNSPLSTDQKHPVIVYLYNGPHAQLVTEGFQWGLPGWDCYMANRGYVVFTIDGRGSDNRGIDFEQAIWHNLGYNEAQDQLCGVEYLKTLPYVDPERIGIYGWSYGGFMTTYMKLNYPETFKVGVCGGPVLDWSRYEVMYGERYMGTPQNNPEGYKANTMKDQTQKLQGHLLIIHDDQDGTVVPQMSYQFLKNAVGNDTYPDFLMYMNHEHNVRGRDRVHLLNNIARYFDEHL